MWAFVLRAMAVLVIAIAGAIQAAHGSQSFVDPRGDAEAGPDIESVTVSLDPRTALLEFLISTPDRSTLTTDDAVFVYVDLDPDRTPARGRRLDYELIIGKCGIGWRSRQPPCSTSEGFSYSNSDGRVSMTFRPQLAVPIDFKVVTVHREGDRVTGDSAPDIVVSPRVRVRHWRLSRSTFRAACVVPPVKGVPLPRARRLIARARCAVGHLTRVRSPRAVGRVLRQAPRPGALLPRGGRVDLVVAVPRS